MHAKYIDPFEIWIASSDSSSKYLIRPAACWMPLPFFSLAIGRRTYLHYFNSARANRDPQGSKVSISTQPSSRSTIFEAALIAVSMQDVIIISLLRPLIPSNTNL